MDTYDFESKHLYRQRRESAIDRLAPGNPFTRKVAYLDTGEALDTIGYLKRGYQPQNLYAINRNPAEVATLTRTLRAQGWPDVNTIGLDFEDALNRRVPQVDIIDFDGMSCLHDDLLLSLNRIVLSRLGCVFGVTLQGGRESDQGGFSRYALTTADDVQTRSSVKSSFGTDVKATHLRRVVLAVSSMLSPDCELDLDLYRRVGRRESSWSEVISHGKRGEEHGEKECRAHAERVLWDVYVSITRQAMVWFVTKVTPHRPYKEHKRAGLVSKLHPFFPLCLYPTLCSLQKTHPPTRRVGMS